MGNREDELRRARQILSDAVELVRSGWSQGAPARDGDGTPVDPADPSARSWSAAGALDAAAGRPRSICTSAENVRAREIAAAALQLSLRSDGDSRDGLNGRDGAIRHLSIAAEHRDEIAVECLRCGSRYAKPASRDILAGGAGCPTCAYQGWTFADGSPGTGDGDA
jgi:hypothetical protein